MNLDTVLEVQSLALQVETLHQKLMLDEDLSRGSEGLLRLSSKILNETARHLKDDLDVLPD